ncbi:hypothetical protein C7271_15800, partial [filamentous cyanobacterium CCP5]
MVLCPNCRHSNPDRSIQCEACATPLPAQSLCPSCGTEVYGDASFCGHCGFDLRIAAPPWQGTAGSEGAAILKSNPQWPQKLLSLIHI